MNHLGEILRRIRLTRGGPSTTLADFGRSVGASGQFIGLVERGRKRISEDTARRIAERYGTSEEDRRSLLRELLDANAAYRSPEAFEPSPAERALVPEPPLAAIVALVEEDMARSGADADELGDALGIPPNAFERFLAGSLSLSREAVRHLAESLGANPEEYAIAAGYLPDALCAALEAPAGPKEHRRTALRAAAALDQSLPTEPGAEVAGSAFGELMRRDVARLDITVPDLASRTGISPRRVERLLSGDPATRTETRGLAAALGVSSDLYQAAAGFLSPELAEALVSAPDLFDLLRTLLRSTPAARSVAIATLRTLAEQLERLA